MSKATLKAGLVDTPLLRSILNAEVEATQFAIEWLQSTRFQISESSVMTLLVSAKDASEYAERKTFFSRNIVHNLTARIIRGTRKLLSLLPVPCPMSVDDAVVAATAIEHALPLYTLDPTRFAAVPGLTTIQPY